MINVNDFDKGYQDGLKDAINGDKKEYGGLVSVKSFFFGDVTMDTYIKGYDTGYLDGLRKRNNVFSNNDNKINSTTQKHTNMPNPVYASQIDILDKMKLFLQKFNQDVEEMMKTYRSYLDELDSEGLDVDNHTQLVEYYQDTEMKLKDVVSIIEENDLPYTEKMIRYLEDRPV